MPIPAWRPIRAFSSDGARALFKPLPLEPVGASGAVRRLQTATTLSRGRALSASRYISVDARPFMKAAPAAVVADTATTLHFLCHSPDGRFLYIDAAYHIHVSQTGYKFPFCKMSIDLQKQTAHIQHIHAIPGLATGTTWIEVAKAICYHLGVKKVSVDDAATKTCPSEEKTIGYSHFLALRRGTGYYEGLGFRHEDHARWRRLVASVARLPADRVKAELRSLLATLPSDDTKEKLQQFVHLLDHVHCPTTHAECMSTRLSCSGFAEYEEVLGHIFNLLDDTAQPYPSLRLLTRLRNLSFSDHTWTASGGAKTETIDGLTFRRRPNHLVVTLEKNNKRDIAYIRYNAEQHRIYVEMYPPRVHATAVFQYAARAYNVDRIYMHTQRAAFFDFGPGSTYDIVDQSNSDYATAADTRAAVEAAFRIVHRTPLADLVADVRRLRRDASTVGVISYLYRGDVSYLWTFDPATATEAELLDDLLTWGTHFPVAYTRRRQTAMAAFLRTPRIGWIHGRRYHRESFWKAVDVIRQHAHIVSWPVPAAANRLSTERVR